MLWAIVKNCMFSWTEGVHNITSSFSWTEGVCKTLTTLFVLDYCSNHSEIKSSTFTN
ncbi:hypothetical protein BDA96_06G269800 [Sorghum bicolor]|uniref:Uncharacterized protein n=2 Tax=Sorghum bicolor TaxID=4558 RepID=A0A921QTC9_SORBI|nr:hypothetical protein BDA96_06G269800 [Sorghum bicolor]KXG27228.2 hypothetical protein SORBI_3006G246350 [Sorghum bicolor]